MRSETMKLFILAVVLIVTLIFAGLSRTRYISIDVWLTYPDRQCVRIVPSSAGTCDDIPTQHNIVWVDPELAK